MPNGHGRVFCRCPLIIRCLQRNRRSIEQSQIEEDGRKPPGVLIFSHVGKSPGPQHKTLGALGYSNPRDQCVAGRTVQTSWGYFSRGTESALGGWGTDCTKA